MARHTNTIPRSLPDPPARPTAERVGETKALTRRPWWASLLRDPCCALLVLAAPPVGLYALAHWLNSSGVAGYPATLTAFVAVALGLTVHLVLRRRRRCH